MKVGWLCDRSDVVGGAELSQQSFRDAAPVGVTVLDCPPTGAWPDVDALVVHNCTQYPADTVDALSRAPVVKYHHDVAPHVNPGLRHWLLENARNLFCSPLQAEHMSKAYGYTGHGTFVAPAMDLHRFRAAASDERDGTVWLGNMLNHGKGLRLAVEWAETNGPVRFYGDGPLRPQGANVNDWGPIPYDKVPDLLGATERLLFLPTAVEPFGRVVAEAWAAGCQLTINKMVGAAWWIENDPGALDTAAEDFWHHVLETAA